MLSSHLLGDAYPNDNLIEKVRQVHADGDSWSRIARELGEHPALVTTADTESGVDLGVSTFRDLLSEVSAFIHQALAVDRTKHAVLQGFSPSIISNAANSSCPPSWPPISGTAQRSGGTDRSLSSSRRTRWFSRG